jgi:hypothetical protein
MNHHILDLISDSRVARVLHMLQCLATRTPTIVLHRVDETFPSLRHSAVSNAMLHVVYFLLGQVAYEEF